MQIIKQEDDSNVKYKYIFDFAFNMSVVEFCRQIKEEYSIEEFSFDMVSKKWRFNNLEIVDRICRKYPKASVHANMYDDIVLFEKERAKEEKMSTNYFDNLKDSSSVSGLRDYQKDALDSVINAIKDGTKGNYLLVLPTGSGKSILVSSIVHTLGKSVLILQPTKEILQQNYEKLLKYVDPKEIGIYSASMNKKVIKTFTFATIQSIYKKADFFKHFDLMILDECHLLNPSNLTGMFTSFINKINILRKRDAGKPPIKIIGLTATPYRMATSYKFIKAKPTDPFSSNELIAYTTVKLISRMKGRFWNHILYNINIQELIDKGFLCPLEYIDKSLIEHEDIPLNKSESDFNLEKYEEILSKKQVKILKVIDYAESITNSVLVFCSSVKQAEVLCSMTKGSEVVTAKTKADERDAIVKKFKCGKIKTVFNVGVFSLGFDHPALDGIILLRPTRSIGLYCIDEKTEILTISGWKKDIRIGDMTASFSPKTEEIKYTPAIHVHKLRKLNEEEYLISLKSQSTDIKVTNNHRLLYKSKGMKQWRIKTAEESMKLRDGLKIPCAGYLHTKGVPLSDDELRFIGWVMTDGNINKITNGITISQGKHQPHLEEIEDVIKKCGFKFSRYEKERKSQYKSNSLCVTWTISKGKPRGRDNHLRGWGSLSPFLSKDIHPSLMEITKKQFDVLIEAIHLGDGSKQLGQSWTRRSYHISTGNKVFAERLQILGIHNGYRSSISVANYNKNPLYIIHLKKQNWMKVGSKYDGRPIMIPEAKSNNMVWCITNNAGTIITRRNGKVAIMGNCQMLGRGVRMAPGKTSCKVIDMTSTVKNIGRIETIKLRKMNNWELMSEKGSWHNRELYHFKIK